MGLTRRETLLGLGAAVLGVDGAAQAQQQPAARENLYDAAIPIERYEATARDMESRGARPLSLDAYEVGGNAFLAVIWERGLVGTFIETNLASADVPTFIAAAARSGFIVKAVCGHGTPARHAVLLEPSQGRPVRTFLDQSGSENQRVFDTLVPKGLRPIWFDGYAVGKGARFASVWDRGGPSDWVSRRGLDAQQYQEAVDHWVARGFHLRRCAPYLEGGKLLFGAHWDLVPGLTWEARHNLSAADLASKDAELAARGFALVDLSGYAVEGASRFAAIWHQR